LVKSFIFASALLAGVALGLPAAAQTYGNDEVTVNPQAVNGGQVLLYPGGKYGRVVHPLLQPGQADPNAPIHLHMPYPHKRVVHRVAAAKPKTQTATATPPAAPAQQQSSQPPQDMLSYGPIPGESAAGLVAPSPPAKKVVSAPPKASAPKKVVAAQKPPAPPKQTPPPKKVAAAPQQVTSDFGSGFLSNNQMGAAIAPSPPAKPAKTASAEPTDTRGMSKRSSIPFSPGAEEPAPEVLDTVKAVSTELNNVLSNGSARVELEAFGGKPNDKSSDARRISLKRALIVRQLLIDEGVPSERIDVRAMGGASEGSPDRVDIFVRA
jgi:outer membrane protein OmpA-like peptidoglycan-associated protein